MFHVYGVTGVYPEELSDELVRAIGYGFVKSTGAKKLAIGRDNRPSSPAFFRALSRGVRDAGCSVLDLGVCTAPQLFLAAKDVPGMMITASNTGTETNGILFCSVGATFLGVGTGLGELRDLLTRQMRPSKKKGRTIKKSVLPAYLKQFSKRRLKKSLRIVVDAGNGPTAPIINKLLRSLNLSSAKKLRCRLLAKLSPRKADALSDVATKDAQRAVRAHKARAGFVFDDAGERLLVIDDKGRRVRADLVLALLLRHVFKGKPDSTLVYDVRSSIVVREEARRLSLETMESKVGHAFMQQAMRQSAAPLAGDLSGRYYFGDFFSCYDPLLAFVCLLEFLSASPHKLSELLRPLDRYAYSGEVSIPVANTEEAITKLFNHVKEKHKDMKIHFLDGLSAESKTWWFSVRSSNTEGAIRLVIEARDSALMEKRLRSLKKIVGK